MPIVPNSCVISDLTGWLQRGGGRHPVHQSLTCRSHDGEEQAKTEEYFASTKTSDRYPIWTRANVGEVFPDPVA